MQYLRINQGLRILAAAQVVKRVGFRTETTDRPISHKSFLIAIPY
ncbi:hypothetical protein [Okeania sp. SIO1I7]|nr:hypothetical protein [Okeania sp. SIO1I7]